VFYAAQTQRLTSGTGWADLGDALIQAAINLPSDGVRTVADLAGVGYAGAAVRMHAQPLNCAVNRWAGRCIDVDMRMVAGYA